MVFDVFCSINKSVLQFVFQVFQSRSSLPAFCIIETLLCKDKKQLVEYILPFSSSILIPIIFLSSLLAKTLEIHYMKTLQKPSGIDRRTWRRARHKLSHVNWIWRHPSTKHFCSCVPLTSPPALPADIDCLRATSWCSIYHGQGEVQTSQRRPSAGVTTRQSGTQRHCLRVEQRRYLAPQCQLCLGPSRLHSRPLPASTWASPPTCLAGSGRWLPPSGRQPAAQPPTTMFSHAPLANQVTGAEKSQLAFEDCV